LIQYFWLVCFQLVLSRVDEFKALSVPVSVLKFHILDYHLFGLKNNLYADDRFIALFSTASRPPPEMDHDWPSGFPEKNRKE